MARYCSVERFWANHAWRRASGGVPAGVRARIIRIGAANNEAWVTAWRRACSTNWDALNACISATLAPTEMAAATE